MPVKNGDYEKLTADEIEQRLQTALENELDTTAQPGELVTNQIRAEARTLAQNQEESLQRVHRAAFLADATGRELDKVVDIIGLSRRDPTAATGVVRFWRETPPTSNYTIPRGATVQTSGSDTREYETTEKDELRFIEGFESDLSEWSGDTGSFNLVDGTLEVPAAGSVGITTNADNYGIGTTFCANIDFNSGATKAFRFGIQDSSNYFECVLDENAQDLDLRLVEEGSEVAYSNNNSATLPASQQLYVEIEWGLYEPSTATVYESAESETSLCSVELEESRKWEEGGFAVFSKAARAKAYVDDISTRSVYVNIEADQVGEESNLGPDSVTTIASSVSGVERVNNPFAVGSLNEKDTQFAPLIVGAPGETDEELRDRAFNNTSIGGSATVNAVGTNIRNVEGVKALTLKRNREGTQKDGLPPHSFEPIVYGGADEDVAQAIFGSASIDSHDVGGINGVEATYTINSEITKDTEVISWSRPNRLDLNITLDLVVDDTFVGEAEISSIVTNHIGGEDLDGTFINGLDVGEDIYEAVLNRKVVNPEGTGVWEVDSLSIDKNGDGTDDTETTASGAEILAVSDSEVAVTNARDGSITINTTQK